MQVFYCYGKGEVRIPGMRDAIHEGGAGWMRGEHVAEMHVGGWEAVVKAINTGTLYPPIDPIKAKTYWSRANDGDVVLSNFFEDRFDDYHAKQVAAALRPAQPRLMVFHYGFPYFLPHGNRPEFWNRIKPCVDGTAPVYYANEGDDPERWSDHDYRTMGYLLAQSRKFIGQTDKKLGFVISPQPHGSGSDLKPIKLAKQIEFLADSGVEYLFIWSKHAATPANLTAAKTALQTVRAVAEARGEVATTGET